MGEVGEQARTSPLERGRAEQEREALLEKPRGVYYER
jgi:hypothetical protein